MNAAASAANPLTTDINDQPPWSDDMTNQGNPVLCEEIGRRQAPHQPKRQQLHITEDFTSDELCEASHNSSIESTSAFSGGFRYKPQTSLQRSSKYGWSKSVITQYSVRCGLISARDRITCAWDSEIPTASPS